MKAILMSIQSKWLCEILNGRKTVELRKRFPKDYRGWVYLYCTKGKERLVNLIDDSFYCGASTRLNGKVVARVWVDDVEELITLNWDTQTATLSEFDLSVESCVSIKDLNNNFNKGFAIHFSKLEIFDKPKELSEFYYYKKRLFYGMDCPPYFDEVKTLVRKAPQSWQYIYTRRKIK